MFRDHVRGHYVSDRGRQYQEAKRSVPPEAFPWIARFRAGKFSPYLRPEDSVLEYGAGLGWNLGALNCARRVAYDLENFLAPPAVQAGIEFISDPSSLKSAPFNAIICHHVLEHVPSPAETLQELMALLRPEGRLLLSVPFEIEPRYRRFDPDEPNHHLYSWNVQTLGNLVTSSGFKLREIRRQKFGYERWAARKALRFGWGEAGFRALWTTLHLVKPAWEIFALAERPRTGL